MSGTNDAIGNPGGIPRDRSQPGKKPVGEKRRQGEQSDPGRRATDRATAI